MWKRRLWAVFVPLFLVILACGVQTIWWPSLLGSFPAPPLWLLVIIWLSVYRPQPSTILMVYACGWMASAFTAMPLKMMFFSLLILHLLITSARERVFWSGASYFLLAAVCSTTAFHLIYILLSAILEPVRSAILPFERLLQILLSAPFGLMIYSLMNRLEPAHPLETRTTPEGGIT